MMDPAIRHAIFALPNPCQHDPAHRLFGALATSVEGILALRRCQRIYDELVTAADPRPFADRVLARLGIRVCLAESALERLPATGPVVVVANHPFGCVEGLVLAASLRQVRRDVKIMANHLLTRIPDLREDLIAVDPFAGPGAAQRNIAGLRACLAWLQGGGALVVFPAGTVAHFRLRERRVVEPEWEPGLGRLIRKAEATVLPVFFPQANSPLFHLAGLVRSRLRTALLARELLNKSGRQIRLAIGHPVPPAKLRNLATDSDLMTYLRFRTLFLRHTLARGSQGRTAADRWWRPAARRQPVPAAQDPATLAGEVARLPAASLLAASGALSVHMAIAGQIPAILQEIGRLRELTFRANGEGTGRALDLDRFDDCYRHLFLWNSSRQEIAGAYRMGLVDEILPARGVDGLYTSTLFRFRPGLFDRLGPALEMGRSFVRPEYQRSFGPLLLLWKGIGQFIVRHPRYRILFGPVSITRRYQDLSRQLIAHTLQVRYSLPDLGRMVQSRTPLRLRAVQVRGCQPDTVRAALADMAEVASLVAELEPEEKDIPVLLKFYLQLGGRVLAFNLDRDFGDALDGLILVDLLHTEPKTLERYLGREGAAQFLGWHRDGRKEVMDRRCA
ncbi:MAG: lysophospholipid acyltransferase family protein [Thermodesulfobacteriota bacterium]